MSLFPPIVVCSVQQKCLPVLEASVKAYAPNVNFIVHEVERTTFGESYNAAMAEAFTSHDEIIICNDDVVLTPTTCSCLQEDVLRLQERHGPLLGFVAACSDTVRYVQNIRFNDLADVKHVRAISPLFAWISKHAFQTAQFPPINWFSDDLICEDLNQKGFVHYTSRAYVHHAGSQTIGPDTHQLYSDAIDWIEHNRPEYLALYKRM